MGFERSHLFSMIFAFVTRNQTSALRSFHDFSLSRYFPMSVDLALGPKLVLPAGVFTRRARGAKSNSSTPNRPSTPRRSRSPTGPSTRWLTLGALPRLHPGEEEEAGIVIWHTTPRQIDGRTEKRLVRTFNQRRTMTT